MDIRVYSLKENESPYDLKECCDKCGCVLGKDEFYFCDNCSDLEAVSDDTLT